MLRYPVASPSLPPWLRLLNRAYKQRTNTRDPVRIVIASSPVQKNDIRIRDPLKFADTRFLLPAETFVHYERIVNTVLHFSRSNRFEKRRVAGPITWIYTSSSTVRFISPERSDRGDDYHTALCNHRIIFRSHVEQLFGAQSRKEKEDGNGVRIHAWRTRVKRQVRD